MMEKKKTIYQVDAFTDEAFKGNPAGVMIVDDTADTDWMQNMAMEMNCSETAFICPIANEFRIRYFTPTNEVPLCGHATLASAHVLYQLGLVDKTDSFVFKAQGGNLSIAMDGDFICMNFPHYPLSVIAIPLQFKEIIGFEPVEMYASNYDWKIAIASSENEIANATPNFELMKQNSLGHLMITAKSEAQNIDFVLRCFAPAMGVNEDPVTGSAHCALTPLWAEKTGKTEFNSFQLSKRTGKLKVKLIGDRVEIKGKAITVFQAELR